MTRAVFPAFKLIGLELFCASFLAACGASDQEPHPPLGTSRAAVVTVGGDTTVGDGVSSTRSPSCPGGELPDQCGTWDGVELLASLAGSNADDDERCLCRPIEFEVPAALTLTRGNAGRHRAALRFRKDTGAEVECRYKGERLGGRSGNSENGWQYVFERCSDGSRAGAALRADWFALELSSSDAHAGPAEVKLRLGEPDVVGGVVQEAVYYSDDPRVPEAALHVPRGAAPDVQDFTLTVLDEVTPGSILQNGQSPVSSVGHALDVSATGTTDFVFTPQPGAACPRIELPFDPDLIEGELDSIQARQIQDLAALAAGQSTLAPVGDVTVDPLRHTVSFCVEHLSFYAPTQSSFWDADLRSATLVKGQVGDASCPRPPGESPALPCWRLLYYASDVSNTPLGDPLPTLEPYKEYTLALRFRNAGTMTWLHGSGSSGPIHLATTRRTPPLIEQFASAWFGGTKFVTNQFAPAGLVSQFNSATFTVNLTAPVQGAPLNLCLAHDVVAIEAITSGQFFGECFSWDPAGSPEPSSGFDPASLVEVCDNVDNDSAGGVDNAIAGLGTACMADVGGGKQCQGAWQCNGTYGSGPNGLTCVQAASTEVCDDIDNDCDGLTDEVLGAACGSCGGFTRCDGSCSVPNPADLGAACGGCGGTVQCDGSCSVSDPPNLGAACGSCGGAVQCDSSCSVSDPADLGAVCLSDRAGLEGAIGQCACGTRQCDSSCVENTPPGDFSTSAFQCGGVFSAWDRNCDGQVEADPNIPFHHDVCAAQLRDTGVCPSSVLHYKCSSILCPVDVGWEGSVPCGDQLTVETCLGVFVPFVGTVCVPTDSQPSPEVLACR